ncbi:MAG: alanine-zipper protein, partial [Methylococcales bacterium]
KAEIERLKAQSTVNASSSEEALAVGSSALAASESAQAKAVKAELTAVEAAALADESNNKLDRMFKQSMMK